MKVSRSALVCEDTFHQNVSAPAFQTARKAQYLVMEIAPPGRPKANAGVLLLDPESDTLHVKLRRDWDQVADADDADVPISNNWVENQIRPIALGRANWLFAGSLRAGKRAAAR